jgi:cobalamin synthase
MLKDWRIGCPAAIVGWFLFVYAIWWLGEPANSTIRWWVLLFWLVVVTPVAWFFVLRHRNVRAKPEGYVGKFRRTDGEIVHVARLPGGTLMVASETQPPQDLGSVSGPELARWEKLATEPDG